MNAPPESAVIVPEDGPVRVTVEAGPPGPAIMPLIVYAPAAEEKLTPSACPFVILAVCEVGLKVKPTADGLTR